MNSVQQKLITLNRYYNQARTRILSQGTRTWKYCRYQGCNKCIMTNGLVPKSDPFAGKYGPKDRFND